MTEPIRGKVAQVLNSREIAINIGSAGGVTVGMYFDVLEPEEVMDPDSGVVLGSIERSKVRVRVSHVQEKISVATTFRKKRVNVGGAVAFPVAFDSVSQLLLPPKWITKYETLKTEEKTWEDLDEKDSYVSTGDRVVQVIEEIDAEHESASQ